MRQRFAGVFYILCKRSVLISVKDSIVVVVVDCCVCLFLYYHHYYNNYYYYNYYCLLLLLFLFFNTMKIQCIIYDINTIHCIQCKMQYITINMHDNRNAIQLQYTAMQLLYFKLQTQNNAIQHNLIPYNPVVQDRVQFALI